jgi:hypothetical protein
MAFLSVVRKVLVCAAFIGVLAILFGANVFGRPPWLGLATALLAQAQVSASPWRKRWMSARSANTQVRKATNCNVAKPAQRAEDLPTPGIWGYPLTAI